MLSEFKLARVPALMVSNQEKGEVGSNKVTECFQGASPWQPYPIAQQQAGRSPDPQTSDMGQVNPPVICALQD